MLGGATLSLPVLTLQVEGARYDIHDYQLARDALQQAKPFRNDRATSTLGHGIHYAYNGESEDNNLDGWSCQQWEEWGQKKSSIASKVANLNGCFKEQIRVLESRMSALTEALGYTVESQDPLSVADPWARGKVHREVSRRCAAKDTHTDAWRGWNGPGIRAASTEHVPSSNVGKMAATSSPKGPWEHADPASSFVFKPSVASWFVLPPCSSPRPGRSRTEPIGLPLSQCSRPGWAEEFETGECESPEPVSLDRREEHDVEEQGEEKESGGGKNREVTEARLKDDDRNDKRPHSDDHEESPSNMKCYDSDSLIRRIQAFKGHSWDPITERDVALGAVVLADTKLPSDVAGQEVRECARGIVVEQQLDLKYTIAFLNKGDQEIMFATLVLPDIRILSSVVDTSDDAHYDSE